MGDVIGLLPITPMERKGGHIVPMSPSGHS